MIEQTFHTPLPLTLEVSIPSGDIDVDTTGGEDTSVTVDGDERLLEHVEVRQDGNRVAVTLRDKNKVGFSFSLGFDYSSEISDGPSQDLGGGLGRSADLG